MILIKLTLILVTFRFVCCETILDPTLSHYSVLYDDISTVSNNVWNKKEITWCVVNYTETVGFHKLLEIMDKVYSEWEGISGLKFKYNSNYFQCENKIFFVDSIHNVTENDKYFISSSVLAHAFYPPIGGIHFNINVNWSRISLYNVALHEVGHTLGLSHILDEKSIMFPYYLEKPENFSLKNNLIDEAIIKKKYSNVLNEPVDLTTQVTFEPTPKTIKSKIYEGYECVSEINWCNDDLNFSNIFSLDGKLYLYKNYTFWILEKNGDTFKINKEKFSHNVYFNDNNFIDNLISVIRIKKHNNLVLFFKNKLVVKSLNNCYLEQQAKLNILNGQLVLNYKGVYYNETEDSVFFFGKPLSYSKITGFSSQSNVAEEKPIQLFKLSMFNYDKVFEFDNKVFFMKGVMLDYFDWNLKILVKGVSFKHYFLKDECDLLPLINLGRESHL